MPEKLVRILMTMFILCAGVFCVSQRVSAKILNLSEFSDEGIRKALNEVELRKIVDLWDEENKETYQDEVFVPLVDEKGNFESEEVTYLQIGQLSKPEELEKLEKLGELSIDSYLGETFHLNNESLSYVAIGVSQSDIVIDLPNVDGLDVYGTEAVTRVVMKTPKLQTLTIDGKNINYFSCDCPEKLTSLRINGFQEKELKLLSYPKLEFLEVQNSKIHKMTGINELSHLATITCVNTDLGSLDLSKSKSKKIIGLHLTNCGLTSLRLPEGVKYVDVRDNRLKKIKVPKSVDNLTASGNRLTNVDLSKNSKLFYVDLGSNKLKKVKLPARVHTVMLENNCLKDLDVRHCKRLKTLYVENNKKLEALDVSCNKKLSHISVGGTGIHTLALKNETVWFYYNGIKKNKRVDIKEYIGSGWKVDYSYRGARYDEKTGQVKATKKGLSRVCLKKGKSIRVIQFEVKK